MSLDLEFLAGRGIGLELEIVSPEDSGTSSTDLVQLARRRVSERDKLAQSLDMARLVIGATIAQLDSITGKKHYDLDFTTKTFPGERLGRTINNYLTQPESSYRIHLGKWPDHISLEVANLTSERQIFMNMPLKPVRDAWVRGQRIDFKESIWVPFNWGLYEKPHQEEFDGLYQDYNCMASLTALFFESLRDQLVSEAAKLNPQMSKPSSIRKI